MPLEGNGPNRDPLLSVPDEAQESRYVFEGHIDFYGYHAGAQGWFIGGWLSHPWPLGYRPDKAVAFFGDTSSVERTYSTLYHREDVRGRGIGFVFFLASPSDGLPALRSIQIDSIESVHIIYPTPAALAFEQTALIEHLRPILRSDGDGSERNKMRGLLMGSPVAEAAGGFVDYYGYDAAAGGWLFCGWITLGWQDDPPTNMAASFQEGDIGGEAFAVLFPRSDLKGTEEGIAFFIQGSAKLLGNLCSVSFRAGPMRATLYAAPTAVRLHEAEMRATLRPILDQAAAGRHRDHLDGLLVRQPYTGQDTLAALDATIFVEVDEAILCGTEGLILMGWCLARPGDLHAIRIRSGTVISPVDLTSGLRIDRPDVMQAFAEHGFDDPRCGFIVFVRHAIEPGADSPLYIEVETRRHRVGYRNMPRPRLEGLAAMRRLLAAVDVRFEDVQHAFDRVLGPAIAGLNRQRLATRPAASVIDHGEIPARPRFSVIIPVHGRLDFIEYQMGLFSARADYRQVEFIYVLDDPPKRREAQFLFTSVYERFLIPFRTVLLDRNVGFAPANNIGLSYAQGHYVAYLNSDVFPGTLDWLEQLSERLEADPILGAIGPALLFEDNSIQHEGMHFTRLTEFGGWFFGQHRDKGMRQPSHDGRVKRAVSITGACMVLRRDLAEAMGGFDEVFVIGDFEDSDLCLRLAKRGLACGVDPQVHLFHLERKSQIGSEIGWRMNLTLYNAWQHERRWSRTIAQMQGMS